jgi:hypothetical protein
MGALMGCGKCGETYEPGTEHICKKKEDKPVTIESLQKHINLLQALLKNHSERIKTLEMKVYR